MSPLQEVALGSEKNIPVVFLELELEILLLVPPMVVLLVLVALGLWQVQRLHEKDALLTAIAERMKAVQTPVDDVLRLPLAEMEWRRVQARGRFLHDKEAYVYATEFDLGMGVHVLTPLVLAKSTTALAAATGSIEVAIAVGPVNISSMPA